MAYDSETALDKANRMLLQIQHEPIRGFMINHKVKYSAQDIFCLLYNGYYTINAKISLSKQLLNCVLSVKERVYIIKYIAQAQKVLKALNKKTANIVYELECNDSCEFITNTLGKALEIASKYDEDDNLSIYRYNTETGDTVGYYRLTSKHNLSSYDDFEDISTNKLVNHFIDIQHPYTLGDTVLYKGDTYVVTELPPEAKSSVCLEFCDASITLSPMRSTSSHAHVNPLDIQGFYEKEITVKCLDC
jgi:hypothetical protein